MKTWRVIWRIGRFRPWLFLANTVSIFTIFLCLQVPGLAMREVLNLLTGDAPVRLGFWAVIAFIAASGVGMMAAHIGIVLSNVPFMFSAAARGLGTCWVALGKHIQDRALLDQIGMPKDCEIVAPIIVGYPKKIPDVPPRSEPQILRVVD